MNSSLVRAYVGLGSNLNNPVAQVRSALAALDMIPATCCVAYSSLYCSKPLGSVAQPDYVNAVAALDTHLSAHELLQELHMLEAHHGRGGGGGGGGPGPQGRGGLRRAAKSGGARAPWTSIYCCTVIRATVATS